MGRTFTEKELIYMEQKLRSLTAGPEKIKVVYLGKYQGFHFGKIIEAVPRAKQKNDFEFPYPRYSSCEYRIYDEDGDSFSISKNVKDFEKGFYPVPEHYVTGTYLIDNLRNLVGGD